MLYDSSKTNQTEGKSVSLWQRHQTMFDDVEKQKKQIVSRNSTDFNRFFCL